MSDFSSESFKMENHLGINISKDFQPPRSVYGELQAPEPEMIWGSSSVEEGQPESQALAQNSEEAMKNENSSRESSLILPQPQIIIQEPLPDPNPVAAHKPCKCPITRCLQNSCACHKANRKCSDLCRCKQCDNHRFKKPTFIRCDFGDFGNATIKLAKRKPISKI